MSTTVSIITMAHPPVDILFAIIAYLDACFIFFFVLQSLAFFHNINETLCGLNIVYII